MIRVRTALVFALTARAALGQDTRPTTRVPDCTAGGCHAGVLDYKFLHGPASVRACEVCHEYRDAAAHTFAMPNQGAELCAFCHIGKTGTESVVVHEPVAKGQCLACHNPHGGASRQLFRAGSVSALCASCHKDTLAAAHAHKPAGEDCTVCHQAHTARHPKLLKAEPRELCLSCHGTVGLEIAASLHPHEPVEGDCLQCHTPHASNEIKGLKAPPRELCASCHVDLVKAAAAATHPHSAVLDGRACLNCHSAHAGERANLLPEDTLGACLECHRKPITRPDGRVVAGVAELALDGMHRHGPAAEGGCSGCHGVHGGDLARLLTAAYSTEFYGAFSEDAYALCFKCHDPNLVRADPSKGETAFRDGERNLHTLHVNPSPQGRSCRACHATHASKSAAHVADSVPFGQWKLPINFTTTPTGGSCAPGCHKPASYDRESPLLPPVPPAAPNPKS